MSGVFEVKKTKKKIILASAALVLIIAVAALIIFFAVGDDEEPVVLPPQETYIYKDFEYTVLDNGKIEIISYNGKAQDVDIPDAIAGRTVYSIGESAFRGARTSPWKARRKNGS